MSLNKLKELVFSRAKGLCEYCKSPSNVSPQPFVVEHVIPKSKGGETVEDNLALSYQGCNNHKYTKTAGLDTITGEQTNLFNPRQQEWNQNFMWSENVLEIFGISATGRVTVNELKLNREELQNLRKLLANAGKHPPK